MFQAIGYRVTYLAPAFRSGGTSRPALSSTGLRFLVAKANESLVLQNCLISITKLYELDGAKVGECELLVVVPSDANRPVAVMTAIRTFEGLLENLLGLRIGRENRVFQDLDEEILGMVHVMDALTPPCLECGQPANWVRSTQFAGEHYFCTTHAEQEPDFGASDPNYFVWKELESASTA